MTSKELLEIMNKGIAREIQVSIQYMWQHVLWKGISGFAVKDELKDIAITEMKHAEAFAERLSYLGGTPTIKPDPINVRDELKDMIEQDKKDEEGAINLYKQGIEIAMKEGDLVTAKLFRNTLEDEEEHHDFFTSLLEDM
jgi:bacterioferritin